MALNSVTGGYLDLPSKTKDTKTKTFIKKHLLSDLKQSKVVIMTIVGFDFTKIDAEKKGPVKGKISINNNVTIKSVEEHNLNLGKEKQNALKFVFEFASKYDPNIGIIKLVGNVIYMAEQKKIKEVLDGWKKDKKLPKDISTSILNTVLTKCNIQSLILSRDINLPPPIPLPKVRAEQDKGYIG